MIELELYESERPIAIIKRVGNSDLGGWARLQESLARGIVGGAPDRLDVAADVLLAELEVLREVRNLYSTELKLGEKLQNRLRLLGQDRRERELALVSAPEDIELLVSNLSNSGFIRQLKDFQLKNLSRLTALPHAADFSVPGAGKTTVALANFAIQRSRGRVERALVVAPLAAFAAWKEDSNACFSEPPKVYVHSVGDESLPSTADILLTNYHRLSSDYDRLRNWVSREPTHVILDEAHRVKKGRSGAHGRAALDLAFTSARRDVLSGTPAPQGAYDLVALMRFLYPGQDKQILPEDAYIERLGRTNQVLRDTNKAIRKYFVRTCKSDLGLPPTTMSILSRPMGSVQAAIYQALLGEYRGKFHLGDRSRRKFRNLGKVVMYLLEAATNPLLLTAGSDVNDLLSFEHEPLDLSGNMRLTDLLSRYAEFERPWKYEEVFQMVKESSSRGEKTLVWSTFVRNIKSLQKVLADFNPAIVHGGIPPKDGAPPGSIMTREDELDRSRFDDSCTVLLANPAACGEGVSLHHWCHHAIYLDRSFNAGHFLQSQDRIHRLGLGNDIITRFTILVSEGSIDESANQRLEDKVVALVSLMDDPELVRVSLPSDELSTEFDSRAEVDTSGMDELDTQAILKHVTGT